MAILIMKIINRGFVVPYTFKQTDIPILFTHIQKTAAFQTKRLVKTTQQDVGSGTDGDLVGPREEVMIYQRPP